VPSWPVPPRHPRSGPRFPPFLVTETFLAGSARVLHELFGAKSQDSCSDALREAQLEVERQLGDARRGFRGAHASEQSGSEVVEKWIVQESHAGQRRPVLTVLGDRLYIYKPRPVSIDLAFDNLVGWYGEVVGEPISSRLAVTPRDGLGWTGVVEHRSCADSAGIELYYRRLGMLGALIWVIGATDATGANLVAAGELPTLIDPELTLVPGPALFEPVATELRRGAVAPFLAPDASGFEISFGAAALRNVCCTHRRGSAPVARWCAHCHHVPFRDGVPAFVDEYPHQLVDGFAVGLRVLCDHADELLRLSSPLSRFETAIGRVVIRPSASYALVRDWSFDHLRRNGCWPSMETMLGRLPMKYALGPDAPSLIAEERRALQRGDLPRFELGASNRTLSVSGVAVARFMHSGFERARGRIRELARRRVVDVIGAWELQVRSAIQQDARRATSVGISDGP
jgi:hypothetical protein